MLKESQKLSVYICCIGSFCVGFGPSLSSSAAPALFFSFPVPLSLLSCVPVCACMSVCARAHSSKHKHLTDCGAYDSARLAGNEPQRSSRLRLPMPGFLICVWLIFKHVCWELSSGSPAFKAMASHTNSHFFFLRPISRTHSGWPWIQLGSQK